MAIEPSNGRPDGIRGPEIPVQKKTNWLPWILAALGILALIFLLSTCNREEAREDIRAANTEPFNETAMTGAAIAPAGTAVDANTAAATNTTVAAAGPGGAVVQEVRTYVASTEPAGRRFNLDQAINFPFGSAALPPAAQPVINDLAALMQENPNMRVRIEGHADAATGTAAANQAQAAQRARAVQSALVGAGVSANRIQTASAGQSDPTATNQTPAGAAQNRRVDLVVVSR